MHNHIRIVGILHIVFASLVILVGMGLLALFGGLAALVTIKEGTSDAMIGATVLGGIGMFLFVLMAVLSVPGLIAGIGLLRMRPWARILTIVVSALELLSFPFGTALGVYGLWVMVQPETERLLSNQLRPRAA
jgi:hypothetical protein